MLAVGHTRVLGAGVCLPETRVRTAELMAAADSEARLGVSENWLERVTGVREKRVSDDGTLPSDMAVAAARRALDQARVRPREIDALIYAGMMRDRIEPATAHIVHEKLGVGHASIVFDVSNACHGFLSALYIMDTMIGSGQVKRGLVVCGEQGKRFADEAVTALRQSGDRHRLKELAAGLTLGDAGAAMLLAPKTAPHTGFAGFTVRSYSKHSTLCTAGDPLGESALMSTDMPALIKASIDPTREMFTEFFEGGLGWERGEIAKVLAHQVGRKALRTLQQVLGLPSRLFPSIVERYGNLVTANIPVLLHELDRDGEVQTGDKLYVCGQGSGLSLSQAGLVW